MILIDNSYHGSERKMEDSGQTSQKILGSHRFHAREMPFLNREGTAKKNTFFLLIKVVGVWKKEPNPPSCMPAANYALWLKLKLFKRQSMFAYHSNFL